MFKAELREYMAYTMYKRGRELFKLYQTVISSLNHLSEFSLDVL